MTDSGLARLDAKGMTLPKFTKKEDYETWKDAFAAYARMNNFHDALFKDRIQSDLPAKQDDVLDETVAAEKKQMQARQRNTVAMAAYTMALMKPLARSAVLMAKTRDWPDGLAWMVTEDLKDTFQPDDRVAETERSEELMGITMKDKEDPFVVRQKIAEINNRYASRLGALTEKEMCTIILKVVPREYRLQLLEREGNRSDSGLSKMTSKQMFQVMQDRYRAMNPMRNLKTSDDDGEENPEVILAAALGNMKIDKKMREGILAMVSENGASNKCFICGETGHKSYECGRNKDNDEEQKDRRRFKGKCNHCGRIGHKSERCWSKEENAHLRPPWFKGTTETGNASIDGECVLTNVDVIPKEVVCTTQPD